MTSKLYVKYILHVHTNANLNHAIKKLTTDHSSVTANRVCKAFFKSITSEQNIVKNLLDCIFSVVAVNTVFLFQVCGYQYKKNSKY